MKPTDKKPELSTSSRFNRRAMRVMNIIAITMFVLAIVYKIFFDK